MNQYKPHNSEEYWKNILYKNHDKNLNFIHEIIYFLQLYRGFVFEKPIGEHVIILCSGGMDSVTLVDLVIKNWNSKVILLYFRRDSRNQLYEEQSVDYFYSYYKEKYSENILELIKLDIQIPSRVNKNYLNPARKQVMGLPMRNATMWDNAVAQSIYLEGKYDPNKIRTIIVGSVKEDDFSPESSYLSVLSQTLHACICTGVWDYQFLAPMMDSSFKDGGMDKADLFQYCSENGIPIEKSRSCFGGNEKPCGLCLACENRMKALAYFKEGKPK